MDTFKIREMIAESGKLRITEAVAYVVMRMPEADKRVIRNEAKEMITEAKKFLKIK
jgi:hypothetical protein